MGDEGPRLDRVTAISLPGGPHFGIDGRHPVVRHGRHLFRVDVTHRRDRARNPVQHVVAPHVHAGAGPHFPDLAIALARGGPLAEHLSHKGSWIWHVMPSVASSPLFWNEWVLFSVRRKLPVAVAQAAPSLT